MEDKVHIKLLHILKSLNAPLKALSHILNWAAKANNGGHMFKVDCQPSQEKVCANALLPIQHEGIDTKRKAALSPIFTKGSFDDIF